LKSSLLIGIVLAVVIMAAALVAPQFRSSARKQAEEAERKAALARRLLYRYDAHLPDLARRADSAQLADAELERVLGESQARFEALAERLRTEASDTRRSFTSRDLEPGKLETPGVSAPGLRTAVSQFEKALQENQKLLDEAGQYAREATQLSRDALGVGQALGAKQMMAAERALADAQVQRQKLAARQAEALALATEWQLVRGSEDMYHVAEFDTVLTGLRTDRDELAGLLATAEQDRSTWTAQLAQGQAELESVRAELSTKQEELRKLEQDGFQAGNDDDFARYRQRYLELSGDLERLQTREQELASGGLRGAEIGGESLETGELAGGEEVLGVDELERRLAVAQERAERLTAAVTAVDDQLERVQAAQSNAQTEEARFAERKAALRTRAEAMLSGLQELAKQAYEQEDQALSAAQGSVTAFNGAAQAANAWRSAAQSLRSEKDPEGKNLRLQLISQSQAPSDAAKTAAAEANVLIARIHAQRVTSVQDYQRTLVALNEVFGEGEVDEAALQAAVDTARETGTQALHQAESAFKPLAEGSGSSRSYAQAALANVYYLLSKLDEAAAADHLANAVAQLRSALEGQERSPYLSVYVVFREHLKKFTQASFEEPAEQEEPAPAEAPPAEEG